MAQRCARATSSLAITSAAPISATRLSLWPCGCGGSRFLVLDDGRLGQHNLAHDYPVANSVVIDCRWHVRANRRQTRNATFGIQDRGVFSVIITHWRRFTGCPECEVLFRIRRVGYDCPRGAGCCLLGCCRACYRICTGRRCGSLRERRADNSYADSSRGE